MPEPDKYAAVWVSHSSISDFLACPRCYYLRNIYKDPATNRKISLISPAMALGQAVHEVLESLSVLPAAERFEIPLPEKFKIAWKKIAGERGGFTSLSQEERFRARGEAMITRVVKNPGPLARKAVKINADLPHYWLSEEANIILCGKIDWLEYLEESDSVHVIDFKTSRTAESTDSLQLLIYRLLASNCQKRPVVKASYWYLEKEDGPVEQALPDPDNAHRQILEIAKKIKLHRQLEKYDCPEGHAGCRHCQPLEKILTGQALLVGVNDFNQNVYVLKEKPASITPTGDHESVVL